RQAPYSLVVRETIGAHPLDGGVIVFDLPAGLVSASTGESLNYWSGLRNQLEARQVQVTLRSMPGDPTSTEVTMTADLRPGVRRNVRASKWIDGIVGGRRGGCRRDGRCELARLSMALSLDAQQGARRDAPRTRIDRRSDAGGRCFR